MLPAVLKLDQIHNCRDLGGYPTKYAEKKVNLTNVLQPDSQWLCFDHAHSLIVLQVKRNAIFRSGRLDNATEDDTLIITSKVQTIVDLRDPKERRKDVKSSRIHIEYPIVRDLTETGSQQQQQQSRPKRSRYNVDFNLG